MLLLAANRTPVLLLSVDVVTVVNVDTQETTAAILTDTVVVSPLPMYSICIVLAQCPSLTAIYADPLRQVCCICSKAQWFPSSTQRSEVKSELLTFLSQIRRPRPWLPRRLRHRRRRRRHTSRLPPRSLRHLQSTRRQLGPAVLAAKVLSVMQCQSKPPAG